MYHPDYFVNLNLHPTKTNHLGSQNMSLEALNKASSKKSIEKLLCYINRLSINSNSKN